VTDDFDPLVRLQRDVDELTRPRERGQWVQPDKYAPDIARPDLAKRRRGGFHWPPKEQPNAGLHLSLLEQLEQLRGGFAARKPGGTGSRPAPGPRLTGGADAAELLAEISTGAQQLRRDALRSFGVKDQRRTDVLLAPLDDYIARTAVDEDRARAASRNRLALHIAGERFAAEMARNKLRNHWSTAGALRHLLVLVDAVPADLRDRICRQVHSWVNAARLALGYAAPMITLDRYPCPYCEQRSLITRSDASGDVFCSTEGCLDENAEQPRWTKLTWPRLLAAEAASHYNPNEETAS